MLLLIYQLKNQTYFLKHSSFHYIAYLLLAIILRDTIYNIAPAAKLKHIEIISLEIEPIKAPTNAPIPVANPDKTT